MPAQQVMCPHRKLCARFHSRITDRFRGLEPTALTLPRVEGKSNVAPSGRVDTTPIELVSDGVESAERSEHHAAFLFPTLHGGQHGALVPAVNKLLPNTAKKNRMCTYFDKNVMSV